MNMSPHCCRPTPQVQGGTYKKYTGCRLTFSPDPHSLLVAQSCCFRRAKCSDFFFLFSEKKSFSHIKKLIPSYENLFIITFSLKVKELHCVLLI